MVKLPTCLSGAQKGEGFVNEIDRLIEKYRFRGILPDTNILLLQCVGRTNINDIEKFNRTQQFDVDDYERLERLLRCFANVGGMPFVFAEINSLALKYPGPENRFRSAFRDCISQLSEITIPSERAASRNEFMYLGLTDAAIIEASLGKYLVLTDDLRLTNALYAVGIDVLNFNHIRDWGSAG